ncbi:MAG: M23 family metallopeptidase [Desulfobacteraceae bacterium]|nr:M23 family metallopeptidase [Desulfobacteraceae bacterium]
MSNRLTLYMLSSSGSPVKQICLPKSLIYLLPVVLLIVFAVIGYGAHDYYNLKAELMNTEVIANQIDGHQQEIREQRSQIQNFAKKLNQLKSAVVSLNEFENKIRIIADLEAKTNDSGLFGVGGSMPEDLDVSIPLAKDHDNMVRQMHTKADEVIQASHLQEQSFENLLTELNKKRNVLSATPSIRPTKGWVTSTFGYRSSPFTGKKEFHKALDIASQEGTPIIAPAKGKITFAGKKWLIGNTITIDHGFGMTTRYGHLKEILKKRGDQVNRGDIIALMGNTGRSTGPHLHYEVRVAGIPVNPEKYILD